MSDVFGIPYADVDVALTCASARDADIRIFTGCAFVCVVSFCLGAFCWWLIA